MDFNVEINIDEFLTKRVKAKEKSLREMERIAEQGGSEMADKAKSNAPWVDRTGHARQSINHFVEWETPTTLVIGLSGGMEYSPYLELANDKKYAVLYPTIEEYQDFIIRSMKESVIK